MIHKNTLVPNTLHYLTLTNYYLNPIIKSSCKQNICKLIAQIEWKKQTDSKEPPENVKDNQALTRDP